MTILQVAHITEISGPVQSLARFFEDKNEKLYKIYHPLENSKITCSQFSQSKNILSRKTIKMLGPGRYFLDFFLTVWWIKKIKEPIDKAVGMNCFDTLPIILVKFFRKNKIKEIVFFNTDFSRKRFANSMLNSIYIFLDRFCAKHADKICCNTRRTMEKRIKEGVLKEKIIYTPNGVFLDDIGAIDVADKKKEKKLLFIGHISREHGLQDIIRMLPETDLCLEIIGSGEYEKELKRITEELNVGERVKILGIKSHKEVITYLKNFSGFGIAPYSVKSDWVVYCDPVKVKEYLSCLVPVIVSNVPEIAQIIREKKMGFVYDDGSSLGNILKNISNLTDYEYGKMLENINKLKGSFDLKLIYEKI